MPGQQATIDGQHRATPYLLIAPALALLVVLFMLPLARSFIMSVGGPGEHLFSWYRTFLASAYLTDLGFTLAIGAATAFLTVLIAVPLALLLRQPLRGRGFLRVLVLTPMIVPHIIAGYALWLTLARSGPLFTILERIGLLSEAPIMVGTWRGLLIALVWKFFPVATLTMSAALERIDPALEEAARDCGAGFWRRLVEIILPLVLPGLVAGAALVFIMATAQFSITLIVHTGTDTTTIPLDIYYETFGLGHWGYGSALGIILTTVTLALLALLIRLTFAGQHA